MLIPLQGGAALNDLWLAIVESQQWIPISTLSGPSARFGHFMGEGRLAFYTLYFYLDGLSPQFDFERLSDKLANTCT